MFTINMLSQAGKVKGQGVLSAYEEQVKLVKENLNDLFLCNENKLECCDIMHYHTINPGFFLGLPLAKLFGVTVGYVHFLPETLEKSIHLPPVVKQAFYRYVIGFYKSMDYLVTVNPYFIDRLESYGIDRSKVTYIPNFVSEETFYPMGDRQKQVLRYRYGIPEDQFIVCCAGQLQKRKGFFDYVELARRMPDVTFLWAGNFAFGAISDGYEEIRQVVENPPANLKLLGLVPREQMNELYNLADLMMLPSFEELFPMAILEAMNCGTPILLRDLDIYPNILFDFYLKADSVEGFQAQIERLKTDKTYYTAACESSFRGHLYYSKEHVARMWRSFYSRIVGAKGTRKPLIPSLLEK